jgi:putative heme transporter
MEPVTEPQPPKAATWKRVVQVVFSTALVAGTFLGLMPRIADYSDVWSTIQAMTWRELTTLLVLGAWNVVTYWFVLTASLPGLTLPKAAVANQASTAVANTMPGDSALAVGLTYSMNRSWDLRTSEITLSVLLSGIWNTFIKLGLPVVALALLALQGDASAAMAVASVVGVGVLAGAILVFGLMLSSDRLAARVGVGLARVVSVFRRLLRRSTITDWDQRAARFRARTSGLLERRWLGLTAATIVSHLSLYAVLLVALRNVGVSEDEVRDPGARGVRLRPAHLGAADHGAGLPLHHLLPADPCGYRRLRVLAPEPQLAGPDRTGGGRDGQRPMKRPELARG